MKTKNIQYLIAIVCAAISLSACSDEGAANDTPDVDAATTFAQAQSERVADLKVIYVPAPGFAYLNENEELTGVAVEIMRDFEAWFERHHGIQMNLNFVADEDWSNMYARVSHAQGGVFGLGNVTITQERRNELQFSPPYLYNVAVLITPNDIETITSPEMFASVAEALEPLAFAGTLHEVRIRELRDTHQPNRQLARVNTNQAVIDGVVSGHYSYIDAYNYYRAVEQGTAIKHHPEFNLDGEQFGIIMPHTNDWGTLMTAFFAAESGYLTTSRYEQHLRTHLGDGVADILLQAAPR